MTWTILAVLVACALAYWVWLERFLRAGDRMILRDMEIQMSKKSDIIRTQQAFRDDLVKSLQAKDRQIQRLTTKLLKARHLTGSLRKEQESYQKAHKRQADSIADLQAELDNRGKALTLLENEIRSIKMCQSIPLDFRSSLVTRESFVSDPARVQWAQQLGTSQFWPDLVGVLTNATPVASGKSADYELGLIHGIRTAVTLLLSLSKHPVTNLDAPEPDYGATGVMKNWDNPEPVQPEPAPLDPDIPASFGPDQYV